jgi:hypothetical protein
MFCKDPYDDEEIDNYSSEPCWASVRFSGELVCPDCVVKEHQVFTIHLEGESSYMVLPDLASAECALEEERSNMDSDDLRTLRIEPRQMSGEDFAVLGEFDEF